MLSLGTGEDVVLVIGAVGGIPGNLTDVEPVAVAKAPDGDGKLAVPAVGGIELYRANELVLRVGNAVCSRDLAVGVDAHKDGRARGGVSVIGPGLGDAGDGDVAGAHGGVPDGGGARLWVVLAPGAISGDLFLEHEVGILASLVIVLGEIVQVKVPGGGLLGRAAIGAVAHEVVRDIVYDAIEHSFAVEAAVAEDAHGHCGRVVTIGLGVLGVSGVAVFIQGSIARGVCDGPELVHVLVGLVDVGVDDGTGLGVIRTLEHHRFLVAFRVGQPEGEAGVGSVLVRDVVAAQDGVLDFGLYPTVDPLLAVVVIAVVGAGERLRELLGIPVGDLVDNDLAIDVVVPLVGAHGRVVRVNRSGDPKASVLLSVTL